MYVQTGCDLVHIPTFQQKSADVLHRIFTEHELSREASIETRAGQFAAKEAAIKTFNLPAGSWQEIEITYNESGKPDLLLAKEPLGLQNVDVSISHTGEYALATVVTLRT